MEKRMYAFFDVLVYLVISVPLIILAVYSLIDTKIFTVFNLESDGHLLFFTGLGISIPLVGFIMIRGVSIKSNGKLHFHYFKLIPLYVYAHTIDGKWNLQIDINEVSDINIVKLTQEEKDTKLYFRHWFNKYLKIDIKDNDSKYVYVGNYSKKQINRIIKILSSKKAKQYDY